MGKSANLPIYPSTVTRQPNAFVAIIAKIPVNAVVMRTNRTMPDPNGKSLVADRAGKFTYRQLWGARFYRTPYAEVGDRAATIERCDSSQVPAPQV
jgi:hypothetical protein